MIIKALLTGTMATLILFQRKWCFLL